MSSEDTQKKSPRMESSENCPLCGSRETRIFFSAVDRLHNVPGEFSYHSCDKCQTVFQNPMVIQEDLPLCYPQNYYTHSAAGDNQNIGNVAELLMNSNNGFKGKLRESVFAAIKGKTPENFIERVAYFLSKSRLIRERTTYGVVIDELLPHKDGTPRALEIGCGNGTLMVKLKSVGWSVEGVEWDAKAAAIAEKNSACTIHVGDFRALDLPKESFDLIVLNHVFEHLDKPLDALCEMRKLLAPKGRIVLIYPNPKSLGAKFYKTDWFPWEVPRHLVFLTPLTIKKMSKTIKLVPRLRTKSEFADFFSANSRRYRRGLQAEEFGDKRDFWDALFKKVEGAFVFSGFAMGDEVVVSLQKEDY